MPRTAKRPAGAGNQGGYQGSGNPGGGGQPPAAPTGMPYGEHGASIEAQRLMPVAAGNAPPPAGPAPAGGGGDPMLAALQGALGMAPPSGGGLLDPSQRPSEPVTHGLPSGPGGGPEVLAPTTGTPLHQSLLQIAQTTGDPSVYELAERARILTGG